MQDTNKELIDKIFRLKQRRNAVLLVHNYQRPEVQDIADVLGDSLELSQQAAKIDADVIVFCGVHFMAETASILNPGKVVLLPDIGAGCPMANMITAEELRQKKKELPAAKVVCYINSTAEVKAESDICCTSANAVGVVQSLGDAEIIFVPDQYLGSYVTSKLNRPMVLWPGYCPTHVKIQAKDILNAKRKYPGAIALSHPECRPEVTKVADKVLSTGGMIRFARETEKPILIIGTETGLIHRLNKENPGKTFVPASGKAICPDMKKITLEKVLQALENMQPQIKVSEDIRIRARVAVEKMLCI